MKLVKLSHCQNNLKQLFTLLRKPPKVLQIVFGNILKPWHRLSREAVAAPSLAVAKARLAGALSSLGWWKGSLAMAGGWNSVISEVPSNPNHSVISKSLWVVIQSGERLRKGKPTSGRTQDHPAPVQNRRPW